MGGKDKDECRSMSARQLFELSTEGFVGPAPRKLVRDRLYAVLSVNVAKEVAREEQQTPKQKTRSGVGKSSPNQKKL